MKRVALLLVSLIAVLGLVASVGLSLSSAAGTFPDQAMEKVWNRSDLAVEQGKATRTWLWGPGAFASTQEAYEQSPAGSRLVAYFDKSRMEITNPNGDRNSQWFVTNGLLTKELVTGKIQTGDNSFEDRAPAEIPVAGDPDDTTGPTYSTLGEFLPPVSEVKAAVMATLDRAGNVGQNGALGNYTDYVYFVPETGHNLPRVFWDFLNSGGLVNDSGTYHQGKLFDPTFFATGFPITEAYWSQVKVAGQSKWVLVQAYERRVLTYTPDNQAGWQVEMGNIGRHYYQWRYGDAGGGNPEPTIAPTAVPTATPQPTVQPTQQPATYEVCGSTQSDVYHRPGCRYVARIKYLICWDRPSDAIAAGYRPCKVCNPPTTP